MSLGNVSAVEEKPMPQASSHSHRTTDVNVTNDNGIHVSYFILQLMALLVQTHSACHCCSPGRLYGVYTMMNMVWSQGSVAENVVDRIGFEKILRSTR